MAKKHVASQPNAPHADMSPADIAKEPTIFTEDELAFVSSYRAAPIDRTARLVFADQLEEWAKPEQLARVGFIRLQERIENAPLNDRALLKGLKEREKEILKLYGELWAKKDLAAAGFTDQQLEGINLKWITFSHGFADLLAQPELLDGVKAMHQIIRNAPDPAISGGHTLQITADLSNLINSSYG